MKLQLAWLRKFRKSAQWSSCLEADGLFTEILEPRMMLSTIQVIASGTTGTEQIELEIDGQVVQAWNDIGDEAFNGNTVTRTHTTNDTVAANQVRIHFVNDLYQPEIGFDRNVRIDAIVIDGTRFESEAEDVYSTGTWLPEGGISSGFLQNEFLHSNGFFQFAAHSTGDSSSILVRARGQEGGEQFRILVEGQLIGSGTVSSSFQDFEFSSNGTLTAGKIRIEFSNDLYQPEFDFDRNLIVDQISVNDVVFQTESPDVYSTGTWTAIDGITPGFRQNEWLHTNGYFQFDINTEPDTGSETDPSTELADRLNDILPDGWTHQLFNDGTDIRLQTFDSNGDDAFAFRFGSIGAISNLIDSRTGQELLAPSYQGEVTDRVVQWVLWETGHTVVYDVPELDKYRDRFNLTSAGTFDNRLNGTVDVNATSGTLDVWAVVDKQWQPSLETHIDGTSTGLTRYEVLDNGAILVRRVIRVGDIFLEGQEVELENPVFVGWFPWADSAFNSMALGINPEGVPNHWYAEGFNIPNHQNQPVQDTRGWVTMYNRNNLANGTTMSVVFGENAGEIHLADGSITDMRRFLFNSLDFDNGVAINPALWTAGLPAGSVIDQSYLLIPGQGIQAGTGAMLDSLSSALTPPQVYHPGAQLDDELADIVNRLIDLTSESQVETDHLGQIS